MKKVVNASVGGRSFSMDEDAYARLVAYFNHFKDRLGADAQTAREEVMSDLEGRIAELFDQGIGGASYRVVDLALVSKVVGQLGMPDGSAEPTEDFSENSNSRKTSGPDFSYSGKKGSAGRKFYRDPDSKAIGGVCSGLAALLDIDVTLVRIILLLALIFWGTGFLIYVILWIVVPEARTAAQKCEMHGMEPTAEYMAQFTEYKR